MKFKSILLLSTILVLLLFSCDDGSGVVTLEDIQLSINFDSQNRTVQMLSYTPTAYSIGLKKAVLIGKNGTADFTLFDNVNLSDSEEYSFISSNNNAQSILETGNTIPTGEYNALEIDLYYLQMTLDVYLSGSGTSVDRNMRIYFSDDAELEGGLHQPGDVTVIGDDGVENGWLMGNAYGDFTGMSPRTAAYQDISGQWMDFAGKNAGDYGPFGDVQFWSEVTQPVYTTSIPFNLESTNARSILVEFDVVGTWNCDDINGDGYFNPDDAVQSWHMNIPEMTAIIED